jgi:hypothetical protein
VIKDVLNDVKVQYGTSVAYLGTLGYIKLQTARSSAKWVVTTYA